ncbi:ABC transporter permease, partial [Klebsiella pneumoniae]|nr:ABC transporter permease [Klebsiella pneumoniae]
FIVTLAGFYGFRGIALVLTDGYSVAIPTDAWVMGLGRGSFLGIPISVLLVTVMIAFSWYVFNRTKFGRYVVAVGSNKESLRRSGV